MANVPTSHKNKVSHHLATSNWEVAVLTPDKAEKQFSTLLYSLPTEDKLKTSLESKTKPSVQEKTKNIEKKECPKSSNINKYSFATKPNDTVQETVLQSKIQDIGNIEKTPNHIYRHSFYKKSHHPYTLGAGGFWSEPRPKNYEMNLPSTAISNPASNTVISTPATAHSRKILFKSPDQLQFNNTKTTPPDYVNSSLNENHATNKQENGTAAEIRTLGEKIKYKIESKKRQLEEAITPTPKKPNLEAAPQYRSYQLMGDSQFVRFSKQLLNYQTNNSRNIHYCVSGQTITGLYNQVITRRYHILDRVIVLIGTNDFLRNNDLNDMKRSYKNLISLLKIETKKIILVTVPPIPKFSHVVDHSLKLKFFNEFILDQADDKKVFCVDLAQVLSLEHFEETYADSRPDLVHLNKKGFFMLKFLLDKSFPMCEDPSIDSSKLTVDKKAQNSSKLTVDQKVQENEIYN